MKLYHYFALVLFCLFSSTVFAAAPTCAVGVKGVAPSATITFTAPTVNTDGSPITSTEPLTYNVYQGTSSGTEVKVASGVAGTPIVISTGLQPSTTYYWYVTATNGTNEAAPSNEACKIFQGLVPGAVVITVT